MSCVIFFFPSKVLLSAKTLPIGVERVDYLVMKKTGKMLGSYLDFFSKAANIGDREPLSSSIFIALLSKEKTVLRL